MADVMGLPLDVGAYGAWLIWIIPFIAALIIPAVGKGSKQATGYVAVGFALMSALSAASLLPGALEGHEIHDQINWINAIGLEAGVLADPLSCNNGKCCWLDFIPHYDLQYWIHER